MSHFVFPKNINRVKFIISLNNCFQ